AARLPETLRAAAALSERGGIEIVVADDGSRDATAAVALAAAPGLRVNVLRLPPRGPGAAARAGVLAARGDRILVCDADGAVPFTELRALTQPLDRGFAVAIGCRIDALLAAPRPLHRLWLGRVWRALVGTATPLQYSDTQCGFKLFTRRAAR